MASLCEPADLYAYGLPRGLAPNPGRAAWSVSASANAIELDNHGLSTDSEVRFRVEAGGTLPSPLVAGTTYYAIPVDESHFRVSATEGGSAVDITAAGEGLVVIVPLPITSAIAWASRVVEDMLPAAVVPLEAPFPDVVVMTTAELAAGKVLALTGSGSTSLAAMVDAAQKRLARWAKGVPIRGDNAPVPAALSQSATAPVTDSRGWRTHGGIG